MSKVEKKAEKCAVRLAMAKYIFLNNILCQIFFFFFFLSNIEQIQIGNQSLYQVWLRPVSSNVPGYVTSLTWDFALLDTGKNERAS